MRQQGGIIGAPEHEEGCFKWSEETNTGNKSGREVEKRKQKRLIDNLRLRDAGSTTEHAQNGGWEVWRFTKKSKKPMREEKGPDPAGGVTTNDMKQKNMRDECNGCNADMPRYRNDRTSDGQECGNVQFITRDQEVQHEHEDVSIRDFDKSWECIGWHVVGCGFTISLSAAAFLRKAAFASPQPDKSDLTRRGPLWSR